MNEQHNGDGMEVSVDLADMVQVLTQENAELHQQVTMLKAAVMRLRRTLEERGATDGQSPEPVPVGAAR
jgi:hypothetical protein